MILFKNSKKSPYHFAQPLLERKHRRLALVFDAVGADRREFARRAGRGERRPEVLGRYTPALGRRLALVLAWTAGLLSPSAPVKVNRRGCSIVCIGDIDFKYQTYLSGCDSGWERLPESFVLRSARNLSRVSRLSPSSLLSLWRARSPICEYNIYLEKNERILRIKYMRNSKINKYRNSKYMQHKKLIEQFLL